jgi:hypothetical protein
VADGQLAGDRKTAALAAAAALWVTGAWLAPSGWWHLLSLALLGLALLPHHRSACRWWRQSRWGWALAALVGWQILSVLWSTDGGARELLDADEVSVLVSALGIVERTRAWRRALIPLIVWVALFSAVLGLLVFYFVHDRGLAAERFRIPWIHLTGLNAVLTGLLCSFGAVAALGEGARSVGRHDRGVCLVAAGFCVFGVLATRSRGALLALAAGIVVLVWFERRRILPGLLAVVAAVAAHALAMTSGKEATDLLQRGATGRFEIYEWFHGRMDVVDFVVGKGFGTATVIPESQLGWFVEHPHSAYLAQFYLTGAIGLGLLAVVLGAAALSGLRTARRGAAVWLALFATGATGVLFDTALVFSIFTSPRIEPMLVLLPAVFVVIAPDEAP